VRRYKDSVTIPGAMLEPPDGRTLNGLREQIELLNAHLATKVYATQLTLHLEDVCLAETFQTANMIDATDDQITAVIKALQPKLPMLQWPHSVRLSLLGRKVETLRDELSLEALLKHTDPYIESEFDLLDPSLGALPKVGLGSKIATFSKVWFQETLVSFIDAGAARTDAVKETVELMLEWGSRLDVLEMEPYQVDAVGIQRAACEFLITVMNPTVGLKYKDTDGCSYEKFHSINTPPW